MAYADLLVPARIRFGVGVVATLGELARSLGDAALVVHGAHSLTAGGTLERMVGLLQEAGLRVAVAPPVAREPRVADVDALVDVCRRERCALVVSAGGGSVLDAGKVVAGVAPNGGAAADYLEGMGAEPRPLRAAPLAHIAIPTTAGTGSETTRNAVLAVPELGVKRSIRHEKLLPSAALIDPELTAGCPARQTAYSGLDALSQLIESYVSRRASLWTDALAVEGIRRVGRSLARAVEQGDDLQARTDMAFAAAASGVALSNAGLGLVHALAAPLGALTEAPHGCLCGMLLAPVMRFNLPAALERLAHVGRLLMGTELHDDEVAAEAGIAWVQDAVRCFGLPASLAAFGVREAMLGDIVARVNVGPLRTNPRDTTNDDLQQVLRQVGVGA